MSLEDSWPEERDVATLTQALFTAAQAFGEAMAEAGGPPLAAILTELRGCTLRDLDCLPDVAEFHLADFADRFATTPTDVRTAERRLRGIAGPAARDPASCGGQIEAISVGALAERVFQAVLRGLEEAFSRPRWRARFPEPFDLVGALDRLYQPVDNDKDRLDARSRWSAAFADGCGGTGSLDVERESDWGRSPCRTDWSQEGLAMVSDRFVLGSLRPSKEDGGPLQESL